MQIKNKIDFKKYKRFFAVGCSFTNYLWSTWADIIGYKIKEYYNVGQPGAGNQYIANMVSEIDQKYNLNNNDLVICMWSSIYREDRYKDDSWCLGGNVYLSKTLDQQFVKKWADNRFYLIRDLSLINLTTKLLKYKNVDWDFLSMIDVGSTEDQKKNTQIPEDIRYNYESVLNSIKPSIFSTVLGNSWNFFEKYHNDNHPLPNHYLQYLNLLYKDNVYDVKLLDLIKKENKNILKGNFQKNFINLDCNKKVSKRKKFVYL